MPSTTLAGELRRRIKDQRAIVSALTLGSTDASVSLATLEVTGGRLILTAVGGSTLRSLDVDLTSPMFDTIGKLYQQLHRAAGIAVQVCDGADMDHLSVDVEEFAPVDIRQQGTELKHHVFSDWELERVLEGAIRRHNPTFTLASVPPSEWELVLFLAQASISLQQSTDAVKRKGTTADTQTLLQIAEAFERSYEKDARRLRNVIQPPKEAPNGRIQEGDIVMGHVWRRSARNGFNAPMAVAQPPPVVYIQEPGDGDAEDTSIRVSWARSEDVHFHSYELWLDTQPDVHRQREAIVLSGLPTLDPSGAIEGGEIRPSTSKCVFRAFGASTNYSTVGFSTFIESYGQNITTFNVPKLEPDTDYYVRLYASNINYNSVASNVIKVRTRPLRTAFDPTTPVSVTSGPAGTVVTVTFDATKAAFTVACVLELGGKVVTPTILDSYHVTFQVPTFVQKETAKDLVVTSPTGLKSIVFNAFTVT